MEKINRSKFEEFRRIELEEPVPPYYTSLQVAEASDLEHDYVCYLLEQTGRDEVIVVDDKECIKFDKCDDMIVFAIVTQSALNERKPKPVTFQDMYDLFQKY